MQITYSYRNAPTILAFSESDSFIRGLMGPFGSGKSSACVIEIVQRGNAQAPGLDGIRRTRWAIVRNTYQQLRDTTIKTFFDWLPPNAFGTWNKTEHTYTITGFEGVVIEVMFRALDRPDQISNLLSLELTGAWVNEAREVPWTIIQALMGRVNRYPSQQNGGAKWAGLFFDTNPPEDDSWWYQLFEERFKPNTSESHNFDVSLFKQPGGLTQQAENRKFLPKNYYENLAAVYDDETRKVYVDGLYGYIKDGKPVYPDYNDNIHCDDSITVIFGLPIYRGWDFGLTPACVFSQVTPNGRWQTFDEMIATSMGADRFSDEVLLHCATEYPDYEFIDIGDPAGNNRSESEETSCFQVLWGKGIEIEGGDQTLEIRLGSVKRAMNTLVDGKPQLLIHSRCRKLRKGYQGRYKYRRMQTAEERYVDKPDKNEYSHPHDANQYVATRLFGDLVRGQYETTQKPRERQTHGAHSWMGS